MACSPEYLKKGKKHSTEECVLNVSVHLGWKENAGYRNTATYIIFKINNKSKLIKRRKQNNFYEKGRSGVKSEIFSDILHFIF